MLTMTFTFDTVVIFLLMVAIVTGNILSLLVLYKTEQLMHVNKYFFTSLTLADLLLGVLVAPFSFWTSIFAPRWIYGEMFCHVEAYLAAIFWIASVYSLTWLSIDHYVAIRKPDRYESIMSRTRCTCWVAFVWLASFCFCCPPLFGVARARYYQPAYICIIDWSLQKAYFITSGLMIILPPLIALAVANLYIFTAKYRQDKASFEKCSDSYSRPELYFLNFVVGVVFFVSWFPWCMLQVYEALSDPDSGRLDDADGGGGVVDPLEDKPGLHIYSANGPPRLHFYFMWMAVANSFWKFLLYVILDHDFRIGLKILYSKMVCSRWQVS